MKLFQSLLVICVNGSCLGFVIWQVITCFKTYNDKPIGTLMQLEKSADITFPAITVCPKFGLGERLHTKNATHLENICGIRYTYFNLLISR